MDVLQIVVDIIAKLVKSVAYDKSASYYVSLTGETIKSYTIGKNKNHFSFSTIEQKKNHKNSENSNPWYKQAIDIRRSLQTSF